MVNIAGLNKADVLAALYNASRPQGAGFIKYDRKPMTRATADELLANSPHFFDYLHGRVMKVTILGDAFDELGFDRDNGAGAAQAAVDALRRSGDVNSIEMQAAHEIGKEAAADNVMERINQPSTMDLSGPIAVGTVGLADLADELIPKIDAARKRD